jgi:hypothetical protein
MLQPHMKVAFHVLPVDQVSLAATIGAILGGKGGKTALGYT